MFIHYFHKQQINYENEDKTIRQQKTLITFEGIEFLISVFVPLCLVLLPMYAQIHHCIDIKMSNKSYKLHGTGK